MIRVDKPWGYEEWWARTDAYVGKIIFIRDGHRLSLQYHRVKDESLRVLSGTLTLVYDDQILVLPEGSSKHIPPGTLHRMEARSGDVMLVEVSTPQVEDVVRVQDDYARP
jgi:mannose-6-phosphate isomerase-like protein (cupin superfamily)